MNFARKNHPHVVVRYNEFDNRASCDGALVLDLSRMKTTRVWPCDQVNCCTWRGASLTLGDVNILESPLRPFVSQVVLVDAGTTWGEVNAQTAKYGLAVPAPSGANGVARSTLAGAGGLLSSQYGLTCDNLLEVEIVTTDGAVMRAAPNNNAELFWAVCGAGETVGVVTSLLFKLSAVEQEGVYAGNLYFPIEWGKETLKAERVCETWEAVTGALPPNAAISMSLSTPPAGERPDLAGRPVHKPHWGSQITAESDHYAHPCLVLSCFYNGPIDEVATSVFAPLIALGPAKNTLGVMGYPEAVNLTAWLTPHGDRYAHAGGIITGKPGSTWGTVSAAMEAVRRCRGLSVELLQMKGAVMNLDPSNMAFPHRFGGTRVRATAHWTNREDDEASQGAVSDLMKACRAGGLLKPGVHLADFADVVDEAAAWGQQNSQTIGALRAEYDPAMVLMVNHPAN